VIEVHLSMTGRIVWLAEVGEHRAVVIDVLGGGVATHAA
jgi:hypothetical protein